MGPMKRVLIVQNKVLHYRKALYNELARCYDLTVLHSGAKTVGTQDLYKEHLTRTRRIGPFFLQSGVLREIHSGRYEVVVVMSDIRWLANAIAPFLGRSPRFIYWGHRYSKRFPAINGLRDRILRRADAQILYSDEDVCRMIARGLPASQLFIAPNTLHVPNHADGSSATKDSFVYVGRAQRRKRVGELVRAFNDSLPHLPTHFVVNIVGSGAENAGLRALAQQLGIADRVRFLGDVLDPAELRPLFHRAAALVSPGHVGLAVLHAFAYGVPVVTRRSERHAQEFGNVRDGVNALLYDEPDELAGILVRLANDGGLVGRLGAHGYSLYVRERRIEHMVAGFCAAIEGAAGP